MTEPWSITFLRKEWYEKITDQRCFPTDRRKMRAIIAERRYVFAWRRWKQDLMRGSRPHAVKHPDPAVGWQVKKG